MGEDAKPDTIGTREKATNADCYLSKDIAEEQAIANVAKGIAKKQAIAEEQAIATEQEAVVGTDYFPNLGWRMDYYTTSSSHSWESEYSTLALYIARSWLSSKGRSRSLSQKRVLGLR